MFYSSKLLCLIVLVQRSEVGAVLAHSVVRAFGLLVPPALAFRASVTEYSVPLPFFHLQLKAVQYLQSDK